jgi:FxsC-like protein
MSGVGRSPGPRASYFYLSYSHSSPLLGSPQVDPDQWVHRFFGDLSAAVQRHATPESGLASGFFDQEIQLGADWRGAINHALSTAEVFVPLYSPSYFARLWPGREWACFRDRMAQGGLADPEQRFRPVLWVPLRYDQDPPRLNQALEIGAPERAYAENGLRALLRLAPYQAAYELVVDRLAGQIVDLAENKPVRPSPAPDIATVPSAFLPGDAEAIFAVTVAAPSGRDVPADRDASAYGAAGPDWRPFPREQELPLADYAVQIAEQLLDFAVTVTGVSDSAELPSRPGVLLVDPWFAATEQGLRALRSLALRLPSWVIPILIFGSPVDTRDFELAERTRGALDPAAGRQTAAARLAISGVSSLQGFVSLMPMLVAEAERQYLRHGPVRRSRPQAGSLPLLTGSRSPAGPNSPHMSAEETPDA